MDNIVNKLLFIVLIYIFFFSCVTQREDYMPALEPEYINVEDGIIYGFLKKDIILNTPYGEVKAAAVGWESGYFFDFAYYENGNLAKIWLREEKMITIDSMTIVLPSFVHGKLLCVDFFKNFNISFCKGINEVTYLGVKLPANTAFHFWENGTLRSFTIYQDWVFENILYLDSQQFQIINKKIVPKIPLIIP
jgi:hypothetical protein